MRQDQWSDTITIDGVPYGIWDAVEGGEIDSEETRYRPGGMAPQLSLGGPVEVGEITSRRLMDLGRDWELMRELAASRVGKATVTVARQPLDPDGNDYGRPLVYVGVLKTLKPVESDSNSSDAGTWEIAVTPGGSIA